MKVNPGYCPSEAIGKRVRVWLANGWNAASWPADGRAGCRWSVTGCPFDIAFYEVMG
tara:strand:- start:350 stop:520 length:171 start_codon:yes stop_codon:yes gene_type:complete